ncbi:MAG: helicase-associated domain-containing protein [Actinomycetota bacterium]|nr:helicase-associated domain-containing protein [Actinomycetota bacterium]
MLSAGDFLSHDAIAAFAWPLLIHAGGLAEQAGNRLQLTARGRAALSRPAADAVRLMWRRWVSHGLIDEMSRIDAIKGQRAANVLTALKPRRQTVAAALATCPAGEWVTVEELFATMRRDNLPPTVARSERSLWKLYLVDPEYGSLGYAGFSDWPILEGRYTLCVLFEYAATLGLIDVAYTDPAGARDDFRGNWGAADLDYLSRYDGLRAIRMNASGAYALGLAGTYQATDLPTQTLKVLPNLNIVAVGEISAADRLMLDAYTERTSDRVWSLTATALLAALDADRSLEEFSRFLGSRCHADLPSTVTTLIDDVAGRASRLRDLGIAQLVECADPALATLIANDRRLRMLCLPVGDRHLAIPPEHGTAFRKGLRTLGYALH